MMRALPVGLLLAAIVTNAMAQSAQVVAPTSAPATQPGASLRKPEQAQILEGLLRDREQARPILPNQPTAAAIGRPAGPGVATPRLREVMPGMRQLPTGQIAEGSMISERPGRFQREAGRPVLIFAIPGSSTSIAVEILPSQLLEAVEREAQTSPGEFIVSGELTTYGGKNFLLLRKVLRRVENGNLGP